MSGINISTGLKVLIVFASLLLGSPNCIPHLGPLYGCNLIVTRVLMLYPSENDSCTDDGHNPAAQDSGFLLTENECRTSSGPARNNTRKNLRRLCYFSHGSLLALHVVLLLVYNFHAEHHTTIATATMADIVATMLTVSLQAFYTVYTAVLVFATQRLALSYNFSRRQKLTSIHDISEAWIGIGAALSGLWDQIRIKTSMRATIAITIYLLSISVLHITSSSIIQLQTFNATITVPVSTTIGWPDEFVDLLALNWSSITPLIPVTYQLATLPTAGISNVTVYDLVSRNLGFGEAIINATTISASCDLMNSSVVPLDSIIYLAAQNLYVVQLGGGFGLELNSIPQILWKDQIRMISSSGGIQFNMSHVTTPVNIVGSFIFILLSTAIDLDSSVLNPTTFLANWTYFDLNLLEYQTSTTKFLMASCSLSTNTGERYVDVQTNELVGAALLPDANQQWTPWIPHNASALDEMISSAIGAAGLSPVIFKSDGLATSTSPSVLDAYMMSLFGLDVKAQAEYATQESSSNPNFTMRRYQLENAVAQIAAEAIWMAGQVGEEGGGFSRSTGETSVMQYILQWRLNINLVPLIIATLASFVAFVLAIEVTGRTGAHKPDESHTVKSASPLELLWLAAHMPGLTAGFRDVEKPTTNNLREAGMFDVCLTDNDDAVYTQQHLDRFHSVGDSFQNFKGTLRRRNSH
ncbi:hypothetical protein BJ138DRAFT_931006 [Hygrophoropsis aurantiaca]|uniref:Uncharacterized protein n=1 Tax=Hygrophoropsis aurantiaca TaxID=72124 RepID=A0ACB7ZTU0_9AGAM|nr:hypothetical protein BJ138DRAFT_931006 [Hygrophoropsis aurantiaca]